MMTEDTVNVAKRLWSQYNGITSKVNEKWYELSEDERSPWISRAVTFETYPGMVNRILKANNDVWQGATGITAQTVDSVKTVAAIEILENIYSALNGK